MFILDTIFRGRRGGDASPSSKAGSTKKAKLASPPPARRGPLEGILASTQAKRVHGPAKAGKKGQIDTAGGPAGGQQEHAICPDVLYLCIAESGGPPHKLTSGPGGVERESSDQRRHISIDSWFAYPDLKLYHGPSNIVHIMTFVRFVDEAKDSGAQVWLHTQGGSPQALNALLVAGAYLVLRGGCTVGAAMHLLTPLLAHCPMRHYKTEGDPILNDLPITIAHCLEALAAFPSLGLVDPESLDANAILDLEDPANGDMNWIVPGRILALAGPTKKGYTIDDFTGFAERNNIRAMVRLNRRGYRVEAGRLQRHNLCHYEMYMPDGNIPSLKQIRKFYAIADGTWSSSAAEATTGSARLPEALAVHCRAGLGRTGTMIATFLIKKFNLTAAQVIAYLRMMRPGSVLGMQSRFLESLQYAIRGEEDIPSDALARMAYYYPGKEADEIVSFFRSY